MTTQNVKNPIEFFAKDHREIERLIKEIQRENEVETRASMVRELIRSVVFHTTAEESQLYPLVQSLLPDGNKLVDESVEGHVALETSLSELENTHPRDVKFLPKVNEVYQIFKVCVVCIFPRNSSMCLSHPLRKTNIFDTVGT
jgi:hemerythrin superfamily protein